jgi:prephenate dehydratase
MKTTATRVAFQGDYGAYSDEVITHIWNGSAESCPQYDFRSVIREVRLGAAEFGVLPIRNAIAGRVVESEAALAEAHDLIVVREILFPIRNCLLALPGTTLSSIRTVMSHPMAIAQCNRFFSEHPKITSVAGYDTAASARQVASGRDPAQAAIAGRAAAHRYGLGIMLPNIDDVRDNRTLFRVVARRDSQ